jgi:hypothetical protein
MGRAQDAEIDERSIGNADAVAAMNYISFSYAVVPGYGYVR